MKLLLLLTVFVTVSHQQYHQHIMFMLPWEVGNKWLSPFNQHPRLNDEYIMHYNGIDSDRGFDRPSIGPSNFILTNGEKQRSGSLAIGDLYLTNGNHAAGQITPRSKSYGHRNKFSLSNQQLANPRLFFNINTQTTVGNLLFRTATATFTATSTCTTIAISTCIPRANFNPAAPAAVPSCRRKRQTEADFQEDGVQYPIIPTEVQGVMPTTQPIPTMLPLLPDSLAQPTIDIVSSKEAEINHRKPRFFLGNVVTTTTITTYSVVSSVFTSTFVPAQQFLCLPPGYAICPVAGK